MCPVPLAAGAARPRFSLHLVCSLRPVRGHVLLEAMSLAIEAKRAFGLDYWDHAQASVSASDVPK